MDRQAMGLTLTANGFVPAVRPGVLAAAATRPVARGHVALTFDDGPSAGTGVVLNILAETRARATFFFVGGGVEADWRYASRAALAGHAIGNHSYSHPDLAAIPLKDAAVELGRTQTAITRYTGAVPVIGRPPFGSANEDVVMLFREYGVEPVLWAFNPDDGAGQAAAAIGAAILGAVRDGDIVLLHCAQRETQRMLPELITGLRGRGLEPGRIEITGEYQERNHSYARAVAW
ncbi:peptidoglycan/xylan/chitin deacetylase (PgdA/CDA1 family) [Catenuloplanes nepalensis]|uniref:Peptidoglycan/xylan/chitin deacetylase (PgdA/CDA1 family) n=1 Tax=Catenuloplanes nepalensis TaxID=587533 RepID=A0ABT9N5W0_9ACTN|nr:polysaccharide deacetylase family protein [Catenuloplanes nepalensis]MDP9799078.1 peptidoglycan/xylan/chitin deacetylase (PgdA/CDA1 family) [Catenuloplanes nepalensis]